MRKMRAVSASIQTVLSRARQHLPCSLPQILQYKIVLTRENVFDLHNLARRYMKSPYAPEKTARKNED